MVDETTTSAIADSNAAEATRAGTITTFSGHTVDQDVAMQQPPAPIVETEHLPASERLRAFEDAEIGEDATRINGRIERGYGSKFKGLPEHKRRTHAALEKLVEAELVAEDARTKLAQAETDMAAARAAVDASEKSDAEPV